MSENAAKFARGDTAATIKSEKFRDIRSTNIIAAKGKCLARKQACFTEFTQPI